MQDPSQGVSPPLQNHVHLISAHQFPLVAHLNIEQAFHYLLDAPVIVKQTAPMSWTYVNAPNDGTIWLEWLSPNRGGRLASDGYVWGDPEQIARQEFGGYTIEIMTHRLGYRPGLDPIASHARTRYHFVSKAPNVNAATPDPSLWIVHYHQAAHGNILPVQQVPIDLQTRQSMHERQMLQSQGRLERRDFMLHDREHWPHIQGPTGAQMGHTMMAPGFYGTNPQPVGHNRYPGGGQYGNQQPAAKRQRTQGSTVGAGASDGVPDTTIEDEENTALGDYFDHLTPRDISMARYMQHHRWMEEVFSSPYASGQIVPADLGLGLVGEMKHLTDGILEPPSLDVDRADDKSSKAQEAQPFTNLKKEQVDEFNKRVQKHLEDGQAEIERMKEEHAAKMQEWRKTKTLLSAEKRLRHATWEGHGAATSAYRLEEQAANGHASRETVEDVLKDVEGLLDVKFAAHKDATLVEKGGYEEKEVPFGVKENDSQPQQQQQQQQQQYGAQTGGYQANSTMQSQQGAGQLQPNAQSSMPQPSVSPAPYQQQQQMQYPQQGTPQPPSQSTSQPSLAQQQGTYRSGNSTHLPEGMDLDTSDLNFGDSAAGTPSQQPPSQQQQSQPPPMQPSTTSAPPQNNSTSADAHGATAPQANDPSALGDLGDTSMFNDAFNDFTGDMGDGTGDGLIDFGGGLEESAFGDALHGMDNPDGGDDGGMFGNGGEGGA